MVSITIIVPSLRSGGMERVATVLATHFSKIQSNRIDLITLKSTPAFYDLSPDVVKHEPPSRFEKIPKYFRAIMLYFWLRRKIISLESSFIISLGEGYNGFVITSALGLNKRLIVSNRASPISSLNGFRGLLNPILYKYSSGVIIQTEKAKNILKLKYKDSNLKVIGNPISIPQVIEFKERPKHILNVGGVGGRKNQDWLIKYFSLTKGNDIWKLFIVGDGPNLKKCKDIALTVSNGQNIHFEGKQKDVWKYYEQSSIFAFTSTSEGFPNALGEAMAAGCAVIAYDCVAGPSDLIDDGVNGFLIPLGDERLYVEKLQQLMDDEDLRLKFGMNARIKMKQFEANRIAKQYFDFITTGE